MFQLVYASAAVRPLDHAELTVLLEQSRTNNAAHGITGMLLWSRGRFLQLLEGEERSVRRVYAAILADARHHEVTTLSEGRRVLRQFASWTMAFRDLEADPLTEPGYAALFEDAVGHASWAAEALVGRLRPSDMQGRLVVHSSRALGLFG